jgi:hypothetical protein
MISRYVGTRVHLFAGRTYGLQCQVPEQCMFSGQHAVCVGSGNRNLCQCATGYHFVEEVQLCSVTKGQPSLPMQ